MPSGEDYNRMEVDLNNKPFLQPVDAEDTKASIYYIRQKWIKYACETWTLVIWLHWADSETGSANIVNSRIGVPPLSSRIVARER